MPLWQAYRARIDSKVADLNNVSGEPFAGASIAALFLQAFVPAGAKWAHLDLLAWSPWARPGRPDGAFVHPHGLRDVARTLRDGLTLQRVRLHSESCGKWRAMKR